MSNTSTDPDRERHYELNREPKEGAPLAVHSERRRFLKQAAFTTVIASATANFPLALRAASGRPEFGKCRMAAAPMKDVVGRVAFITGGSSGIGLGIARAFIDAGMKVVIGYRTQEHVEAAKNFLKDGGESIHALSVDVTDRSAMEAAAEETVRTFGKVHVLVNNAGVVSSPSLSKTSYDDWDWVIGVNLTGVFNGVHAFLPKIQAHGDGGQIISASSIVGLFAAEQGGVYTVSRFAVVGMMEALRGELARTDIGVSVYCPGPVITNIFDSDRNRPGTLPNIGHRSAPNILPPEKGSQLALSPLEIGNAVLRGMRNNDLYILTHPEYLQIIQTRNEALIASFPSDMQPTDARVKGAQELFNQSIYATELDRQLCKHRTSRTRG